MVIRSLQQEIHSGGKAVRGANSTAVGFFLFEFVLSLFSNALAYAGESLSLSTFVMKTKDVSPGHRDAALAAPSGEGIPADAKRPFTVADEIGLTLFGTPGAGPPEIRFSPDGKYFAVWSERGRLDGNLVEDSLRFYSSQEVERFLQGADRANPPVPDWVVSRSGKEGRVIDEWRWLEDSSGAAFLEGTEYWANKRLMLADLRKKRVEALTLEAQTVKAFDIHDRRHYVYTALDVNRGNRPADEHPGAETVAAGHPIYEVIFSQDSVYQSWADRRIPKLWAVVDDSRFEVKANVKSLVLQDQLPLALSPDGESLITEMEVPKPPGSWEALYPPSFPTSSDRIHPDKAAHQYVRVGLRTGSIQILTGAPVSNDAGWWAYGSPSWSRDGEAILLSGTFLQGADNRPSRPCVAVVDLSTERNTCVEVLKAHTETGVEDGYHIITGARFVGGDKQRVLVTFAAPHWSSYGSTEYKRTSEGKWQVVREKTGSGEDSRLDFGVAVRQSFAEPPVLVATNKLTSRIVWDPNPQLHNFDLGQATLYSWKSKEGREMKAGLFKPTNYSPGQRYPLVIQTHGFIESDFRPSGVYPPFAARALAAAGIAVLQVAEYDCPAQAPTCKCPEGPCEAAEYEALAKQLVADGLVDPDNIGIIGFSRTCFYVLETLTMSSLRLKAASITDGITGGYLEYFLADPQWNLADDYNSLMGAPPFGEGLQKWLKESPDFNLDKVGAPLLVVGSGPLSTLFLWQPYAALEFLHKPVDFVMLNTREHVLTNPAVRMASQSGSVDWFRFWLQGYERTDPVPGTYETQDSLSEQYRRWEHLCDLQVSQNPDRPAFCVRSRSD